MSDIKIPSEKPKPVEFGMKHMGAQNMGVEKVEAPEPTDKIKVKFEKFVQLVATHNFEEVLKKYAEHDIIMSSNLLTDLANAHEEVEVQNTRIPIWIICGAILGIIITYVILR